MAEFTHLVISGGGIKGAAIIGTLTVMESHRYLENIHTFIGTSVGGLLSMLLTIGYTPSELHRLLIDIDIQEYFEYNFGDFYDNIGVVNGENFMKLLRAMMRRKKMESNITFKELYELTGKSLVVTGGNLTKERVDYFGRETTPGMSVLTAVRITISYPLFFTPPCYKGNLYVDGGLFDPYPINYFPDAKKIGILVDAERVFNPDYKANNEINEFGQYISVLIKTIMARYIKLCCKNYFENTITIDLSHISGINFSLDLESKKEMFKMGVQQANKFFSNLGEIESVP